MTLTPAYRRLTLTTHVTSSVGWTGAVLVFLVIAAIGFGARDERTVRGAYLVMAPTAWLVLVPLAHASLLSGVALSFGTPWGLLRHYWVVLKLAITLFATAVLLVYMDTFRQMAAVAADPLVDVDAIRNASPIVHATLALLLLLMATVLGIYKPFGMTAYGRRRASQERTVLAPRSAGRAPAGSSALWWGRRVVFAGASGVGILLLLLLLLLHLMGLHPRH